MKLKYVALTGADDKTNPEELGDLSAKYPFVEWAILFSQSKAGVPRYPDYGWVLHLAECQKRKPMNLSAHLCGKWVDDVTKGAISFLDDPILDAAFGRIQLNMTNGRLEKMLYDNTSLSASSCPRQDVIFGSNYKDLIFDDYDRSDLMNNFMFYEISPLFDSSGGRGIEAKVWPKPLNGVLCGYAGGLGPDNVEEQLEKLEAVVGDATIWIDMETKLRTDEEFDLKKCEQVLQIAGKWA